MGDNELNLEKLTFLMPESFKGLSKEYMIDKMFNEEIQKNWKPNVGDVIVGATGNVFVISGHHHSSERLGGDKYFFGGGLCNRDGGMYLNETMSYIMNKDGMEYYWDEKGSVSKREDPYYSKFSDFKYVPYPHEL
jgi:hypothetical protein